jgi:hypothetical protein
VEAGLANRRLRRRLSRSVAPSRWGEYRAFLAGAAAHGYRIVSLEDWLSAGEEPLATPTLALRHDVDQHPATALRMAAIEHELGVRSTWYFRWRTAHPRVVTAIRDAGHAIGLHYETLTRRALAEGVEAGPALDALIPECRAALRSEVAAFSERFGPIRSVCPHGDTRVPGVRNSVLVTDQEWPALGFELDGNESVKTRALGAWLSDRSSAEGRWGKGYDPQALFSEGVGPILAVIHPNNWVSGAGLWKDRLLAGLLPSWETMARPVRTGGDQPPLG